MSPLTRRQMLALGAAGAGAIGLAACGGSDEPAAAPSAAPAAGSHHGATGVPGAL